MPTINNPKVTKVEVDSADNFSGSEISTTDIDADATDLEVQTPQDQTDTGGNPYFQVNRLRGSLGIIDQDFLFTSTLASTNTIETEMSNNATIYIKITCEDGVIDGGSIAFRPIIGDDTDFSQDSRSEVKMLTVSANQYSGIYRIQ